MTSYPLPREARDDDERRRRGLIWLWFAIIVVLLAGLISLIARLNGCSGDICGASSRGEAATGSLTDNSQTVHSTSRHGAAFASASIEVTGSEHGALAPGATRPMTVSIRNTGSKPAHITSASVTVGSPSKACSAAKSIRVTHYDASTPGAISYELAPGTTATIPLTISMLDLTTNQNACKNASFPLTFHATAQQG